mmetsp:Transcript_1030/g.2336  ORF Transcript_1030/g.2336 Transcript_1030/m.2336 type:complete len:212 (-) Transcript_1030:1210-1845(-)
MAREVGEEEAGDQCSIDRQQCLGLRGRLHAHVLHPAVHEGCLLLLRGPIHNPKVAEVLEDHDARKCHKHHEEGEVPHGLEVAVVGRPLHMAGHPSFFCGKYAFRLLLLREGCLRFHLSADGLGADGRQARPGRRCVGLWLQGRLFVWFHVLLVLLILILRVAHRHCHSLLRQLQRLELRQLLLLQLRVGSLSQHVPRSNDDNACIDPAVGG